MNEPCLVDGCDRPVGDGYCCARCGERLSRALGDVPALWEELDLVLTKQARYGDSEGRGGERALPFNATASEVGWVLRNTLNTWCRLIAEERGWDLPRDHPAAVAGWVLHHVTWLRHHLAGAEAVEELTEAVNQVRRAIDRPAERIYAGPCRDCGADMYAKPGASSVQCRPCGLEYDVTEMRDWMWSHVVDVLATAAECARAISGHNGTTLNDGTIRKWVMRGRLVAKGSVTVRGRLLPTYRVGDVAALVESMNQQKAG